MQDSNTPSRQKIRASGTAKGQRGVCVSSSACRYAETGIIRRSSESIQKQTSRKLFRASPVKRLDAKRTVVISESVRSRLLRYRCGRRTARRKVSPHRAAQRRPVIQLVSRNCAIMGFSFPGLYSQCLRKDQAGCFFRRWKRRRLASFSPGHAKCSSVSTVNQGANRDVHSASVRETRRRTPSR